MTLYRQGVFLVKGLREFTKNAFLSASKSFGESDLNVELNGKVFMITGANSGIGKSAAIALAKKGGEIHMVCRNPERAEAAKKEVVEESSNENIYVHLLDMSSPSAVHRFAEKFVAEHSKLDVLVNNAGAMVNERIVISEGDLETNFATNTLGTYILTLQLLPLLKKSEKSRVVTVSSGGMYSQKLNLNDLQMQKGSFDGMMQYAQNKRHQIILTEEWARQEPSVHFSVMHPGWADTPAVRTSMPNFYEKMKNKLRTADQGADTIVWLSASDAALKFESGKFFLDRQPTSTHLPLAWTRESKPERQMFIEKLAELSAQFKA